MTQMHLTVDITPTGNEACRVDLRQGPYAEDCEAMAAVGWESAFVKLDVMLRTNGTPVRVAGSAQAVPRPNTPTVIDTRHETPPPRPHRAPTYR